MISEPFTPKDSLIYRLDPRLKVILATIYSFVVALSSKIETLLGAIIFSLVLIVLSRLDIREVFKRVAAVNGLILFLWLMLPFTIEGAPLFHLGPFSVTREGVLISLQITVKSNAILLAFIALIASMPMTVLGHALNRLFIPEKMVLLLLLTYRYLFVMEQEYQRLVRSVKIRGFRSGTNMHTYKTYAYLIGMLFVKASARAERVHQAMLCRGFQRKFYSLYNFSISRTDWICSAVMLSVIIGLALLELLKIIA
ncbi:MAG: cobalt ECF transporter T component CbiQ [Deltaproteobacteria bacterium]|nr:cobalt ECF transporter T component CbiQ [Deltaproteobacteria bacterium]